MPPFVVFNPAAGRAASRRLRRLLETFAPGRVAVTVGPGDGARLAAEAAGAGLDPIVVAGGDGLVAEVVNGLAPEFERVRLALLPSGTGNDFARGLGVPLDPVAALAVIRSGRTRSVDLARIEFPDPTTGATRERWLANALVAGLAGRIARRANRAGKRRWGARAYRAAVLPELARARAVETELVLTGRPSAGREEHLQIDAYALAVANGPFVGGGVRVAPEARFDDGLLDLVVLPRLGRAALTAVAVKLLAGGADGGRLWRRQCRRVRLRMEDGAWLNADGEELPGGRAKLELVPAALRVLAPRPPPTASR